MTLAQQSENYKPDTLSKFDIQEKAFLNFNAGSAKLLKVSEFQPGVYVSPDQLFKGMVPGLELTNEQGPAGMWTQFRMRGISSVFNRSVPLFIIDGFMIDDAKTMGMRNFLNFINPLDIVEIEVIKAGPELTLYGARAANGIVKIRTGSEETRRGIQIYYDGNVSFSTIKDKMKPFSANKFRNIIQDRYADNQEALNLLGNTSTDWQNEIYDNRVNTNHFLKINGNLNQRSMPYNLFYGYTQQDDIINSSALNRNTFGAQFRPVFFDDHLKVRINVKGMVADNQLPAESAAQNALSFNPTQPVYSQNDQYGGYYQTETNDGSFNRFALTNPVALLNQIDNNWDVNRYLTDFGLNYKVHNLPELSVDLQVGVDQTSVSGKYINSKDAAWYDYSTNSRYENEYKNEMYQIGAHYDKYFESLKTNISVSTGFRFQQFAEDMLTDTYDNDMGYSDIEKHSVTKGHEAFYGQFKFSYRSRYLMHFALNRTSVSIYNTENSIAVFPAIAVGWDIYKEPFMRSFNRISNLKVHFSYDESSDAYYNLSGIDRYDIDLTYPVSVNKNLGIDFGFFKQRLTGKVDFYNKTRHDLYVRMFVPNNLNTNSFILTNKGRSENKGFEIELNSKIIEQKEFSWQLGGYIAFNSNKFYDIHDNNIVGYSTGLIPGGVGSYAQLYANNHSGQVFYLYEQVYNSDGTPIEDLYIDQNNDGVIDYNDRYLGNNAQPQYTFGFATQFNYKQFKLSITGMARYGNYVYNGLDANYTAYNDMYHSMGFLQNRINSDIHFNNPQLFSDYYVENAAFIKIKSIHLSYSFDIPTAKSMNMQVYSNILDPFLISEYSGLDPEVYNGIDDNPYPLTTAFMLGVAVSF